MKPALVYLAGPFRAQTPWQVEQHVREAESAALFVAQLGAVPVCVHSMYRFFDRAAGLSDGYWLAATLEQMRRCDAVLKVKNWRESLGALGEIEEAKRLGLPIFDSLFQVADWLQASTRFEVLR